MRLTLRFIILCRALVGHMEMAKVFSTMDVGISGEESEHGDLCRE